MENRGKKGVVDLGAESAETAKRVRREKFLMTGVTGSGKTKLFTSLPGKKFLYLFDPNGINTIKGTPDLLYKEFLPDRLTLDVIALKKDLRDKVTRTHAPEVYIEWERDFEARLDTGWFKEEGIEWIGFDSLTTFSDLIMDRVLWINNRPGKQPEMADYAATINTIRNVFRTATALDLGIYATAHVEFTQDEVSKRLENSIVLLGKLRVKLPLLFSEIYLCECASTREHEKYTVQTRPDRRTPLIRCTIPGLDMWEDVTITGKGEEGLAKLMKKGGVL